MPSLWTNGRFSSFAIHLPSVVLPVPGGPEIMIKSVFGMT